MGTIHVHEFISLDGVIDEPSWTFAYGWADAMGERFAAVTAASQAILLGRRTYEMFEPAWSNRTADDDPGPPFFHDTMKYVVSETLRAPTWQNSTFIAYDPARIQALKDHVGALYVSGSGTLVRALLADGLVDQLHLCLYPLTRGAGPRLFPDGAAPANFETVVCESYPNGAMYLNLNKAGDMTTTVRVLIETGERRCFARALDWPGWTRSGRGEDDAAAVLEQYAARYAPVAARARAGFPRSFELKVVARVKGSVTTDFGAPDARHRSDDEALTGKDLARWTRLLRASWATLDAVASSSAESLRKGPRGGGRDRTNMLAHVLGSEASYARQIGARCRAAAPSDADAVAAVRETIVEALRTVTEPKWPLRYWVHRDAWHVLDHAWEMEDRQP